MSEGGGNSDWTTPAALRERLRKRWRRGDFLSAAVASTEKTVLPLRLPLKGPKPREVSRDFSKAQEWVGIWQRQEALQLEWREASHRLFGTNTIPVAVVFKEIEEVVRFLGVRKEWACFQELLAKTRQRMPILLPWVGRHPFQALDLACDWDRLLAVVEWLRENPRPGIYVRQLRVAGVHTKFVEGHRHVLAEWLDLVLPPEAIDASVRGVEGFNRRYGFLDKPSRLRIRVLDSARVRIPEWLGNDLTLDAEAFARLDPGVSRVFITENEINFLAFPEVTDSLILFGSGYGWSTLAETTWLNRCRVLYWGDIDTHGFAILDRLRYYVPRAESFLMCRATLEAFRDLWGKEPQPTRRDLSRLTPEEAAVYDDLRHDRLAPQLRLEQERIGYGWLMESLAKDI